MIDAHTHVVAPDEDEYPFTPRALSGEWYRDAPCSADDFAKLLEANGVAAAVLVQPVGAYSYDNAYTSDSAARFPRSFASACCIDAVGEDPVGALTYWVRERGMQGVRLFALSRDESSWLAEPRTFPIWERARELDVHVIVTIFEHQLPELRVVLERFPDVPVSLDHCGFPTQNNPPASEARPLFELAELPNLHCKVTTNVIDSVRRAGGDAQAFVAALNEHYGAHRIMWGSDFCQTHDRTYPELVALARRAFGALSNEDRGLCLGGTAARLWPSLRSALSTGDRSA
jgi:predicted TIM-barrel fold metal-dependent hydrolase